MISSLRRHSIHGNAATANGGTSSGHWGKMEDDENDGNHNYNNDDGDDDVSIELETIMAAKDSFNDRYNRSNDDLYRFSKSERHIRVNSNSFRNMRIQVMSRMTTSTSKIRCSIDGVTKSVVGKVRLPSISVASGNTVATPHKLKQKYHEMMSSSGELLIVSGNHNNNKVMEMSDDNFPMMLCAENALLLQKCSNHTGTTRNMTLETEDDDDDDDPNDDHMDDFHDTDDNHNDMYHDVEPLLIKHTDLHHHRQRGSGGGDYVQLDIHPLDVVVAKAAMVVRTSPPERLCWQDPAFFPEQEFRQLLEWDNRSINPPTTDHTNEKKKSISNNAPPPPPQQQQRISPRSLRKFRTVGILEESLEVYTPKLEPIYIRAADLTALSSLPSSPNNSPTQLVMNKMCPTGKKIVTIPSTPLVDGTDASPMQTGRTKPQRVRSLRGGRKAGSSPTFKSTVSSSSSSSPQKQLHQSMPSLKQHHHHHHHHRVDPKVVLDRMTFGPASKHHHRSQSQQSMLVSRYKNLLLNIDVDSDHPSQSVTPKQPEPQRIDESKLKLMKSANDVEIPLSVQRRRQAKGEGTLHHKMVESSSTTTTKITSTTKSRNKSTTPSRERVQFDFDPKDLTALCKAIDQAKKSTNQHFGHSSSRRKSRSTRTSPTSDTTISTTRIMIQPMIDNDTVGAVHMH